MSQRQYLEAPRVPIETRHLGELCNVGARHPAGRDEFEQRSRGDPDQASRPQDRRRPAVGANQLIGERSADPQQPCSLVGALAVRRGRPGGRCTLRRLDHRRHAQSRRPPRRSRPRPPKVLREVRHLRSRGIGAGAGCAILLLTPAGSFDVIVPFLILGASALLAFQPHIKRALGGRCTNRPAYLVAGVFIGAVHGGYFGARSGRDPHGAIGAHRCRATGASERTQGRPPAARRDSVIARVRVVRSGRLARSADPRSVVAGRRRRRRSAHQEATRARAAHLRRRVRDSVGIWLAVRAFG